jgi:RNA polymerase sigma-70 factor (sigma-E family)
VVTDPPGRATATPGAAEDEFSEFVRRVRPGLRRSLFLLCRDWYLADDLVQQTLMIMYTHWGAIRDQAARTSYARTIMVHLLAREQRSSYARRERVEGLLPETAAPDGTEELGEFLRVHHAIANLSDQQRKAVVLRFWVGLRSDEIAHVLLCPAGTVRSHLSRALARLRAELQKT